MSLVLNLFMFFTVRFGYSVEFNVFLVKVNLRQCAHRHEKYHAVNYLVY